eukprot:TRINITY_DN65063_c0_g1_i1.p1 TRINITY_DN65063_c0_g1~~TRINITY_DN65063_c0_g1_i1.p1  ORF type:complete len:3249 (+),score=756.35 TRINITY_DN65063_c0_g1_i1:87-9749(+)
MRRRRRLPAAAAAAWLRSPLFLQVPLLLFYTYPVGAVQLAHVAGIVRPAGSEQQVVWLPTAGSTSVAISWSGVPQGNKVWAGLQLSGRCQIDTSGTSRPALETGVASIELRVEPASLPAEGAELCVGPVAQGALASTVLTSATDPSNSMLTGWLLRPCAPPVIAGQVPPVRIAILSAPGEGATIGAPYSAAAGIPAPPTGSSISYYLAASAVDCSAANLGHVATAGGFAALSEAQPANLRPLLRVTGGSGPWRACVAATTGHSPTPASFHSNIGTFEIAAVWASESPMLPILRPGPALAGSVLQPVKVALTRLMSGLNWTAVLWAQSVQCSDTTAVPPSAAAATVTEDGPVRPVAWVGVDPQAGDRYFLCASIPGVTGGVPIGCCGYNQADALIPAVAEQFSIPSLAFTQGLGGRALPLPPVQISGRGPPAVMTGTQATVLLAVKTPPRGAFPEVWVSLQGRADCSEPGVRGYRAVRLGDSSYSVLWHTPLGYQSLPTLEAAVPLVPFPSDGSGLTTCVSGSGLAAGPYVPVHGTLTAYPAPTLLGQPRGGVVDCVLGVPCGVPSVAAGWAVAMCNDSNKLNFEMTETDAVWITPEAGLKGELCLYKAGAADLLFPSGVSLRVSRIHFGGLPLDEGGEVPLLVLQQDRDRQHVPVQGWPSGTAMALGICDDCGDALRHNAPDPVPAAVRNCSRGVAECAGEGFAAVLPRQVPPVSNICRCPNGCTTTGGRLCISTTGPSGSLWGAAGLRAAAKVEISTVQTLLEPTPGLPQSIAVQGSGLTATSGLYFSRSSACPKPDGNASQEAAIVSDSVEITISPADVASGNVSLCAKASDHGARGRISNVKVELTGLTRVAGRSPPFTAGVESLSENRLPTEGSGLVRISEFYTARVGADCSRDLPGSLSVIWERLSEDDPDSGHLVINPPEEVSVGSDAELCMLWGGRELVTGITLMVHGRIQRPADLQALIAAHPPVPLTFSGTGLIQPMQAMLAPGEGDCPPSQGLAAEVLPVQLRGNGEAAVIFSPTALAAAAPAGRVCIALDDGSEASPGRFHRRLADYSVINITVAGIPISTEAGLHLAAPFDAYLPGSVAQPSVVPLGVEGPGALPSNLKMYTAPDTPDACSSGGNNVGINPQGLATFADAWQAHGERLCVAASATQPFATTGLTIRAMRAVRAAPPTLADGGGALLNPVGLLRGTAHFHVLFEGPGGASIGPDAVPALALTDARACAGSVAAASAMRRCACREYSGPWERLVPAATAAGTNSSWMAAPLAAFRGLFDNTSDLQACVQLMPRASAAPAAEPLRTLPVSGVAGASADRPLVAVMRGVVQTLAVTATPGAELRAAIVTPVGEDGAGPDCRTGRRVKVLGEADGGPALSIDAAFWADNRAMPPFGQLCLDTGAGAGLALTELRVAIISVFHGRTPCMAPSPCQPQVTARVLHENATDGGGVNETDGEESTEAHSDLVVDTEGADAEVAHTGTSVALFFSFQEGGCGGPLVAAAAPVTMTRCNVLRLLRQHLSVPADYAVCIAPRLTPLLRSPVPSEFAFSGFRLLVTHPVRVHYTVQPGQVAADGLLGVQPRLQLLDGANNTVELSSTARAAARWRVSPDCMEKCAICPCLPAAGVFTWVANATTTEIAFDFVRLDGVNFGERFELEVVLAGEDFPPARSEPVQRSRCADHRKFGAPGQRDCIECPFGGACNGSSISVRPGYWRANNLSFQFYECVNRKGACLPGGGCKEGYEGATCSTCQDGYAMIDGECTECSGERVADAFILLGAAAAVLLGCSVLIRSTLTAASDILDPLPILFKLVVNHLVVSSRVGGFGSELPGVFDGLWEFEKSTSSFGLPLLSTAACTTGGVDLYSRFLLWMAVPPGVCLVALLVPGVMYAHRASEVHCKGVKRALRRRLRACVRSICPGGGDDPARLGRRASWLSPMARRRSSAIGLHRDSGGSIGDGEQVEGAPPPEGGGEENEDESLDIPYPAVRYMRLVPVKLRGRTTTAVQAGQILFRGTEPGSADEVDIGIARISNPGGSFEREGIPSDGSPENLMTDEAGKNWVDLNLKPLKIRLADAPKRRGWEVRSFTFTTSNDSPERDLVRWTLHWSENGHDWERAQVTWSAGEDVAVIGGGIEWTQDDDFPTPEERSMRVEPWFSLTPSRAVNTRKLWIVYAITVLVLIFLAYPQVIEQAAQLLQCREIKLGGDSRLQLDAVRNAGFNNKQVPEGWDVRWEEDDRTWAMRVSVWDTTVGCDTSEHRLYKKLAVAFCVIYGVGIPVGIYILVRVMLHFQGRARTFRTVHFFVTGFRPTRWYWELVVLVRKMLIIYLVSFVNKGELQTYAGMWLITVYLVVTIWADPYHPRMRGGARWLEILSLAVMSITINLSLLYIHIDGLPPGPGDEQCAAKCTVDECEAAACQWDWDGLHLSSTATCPIPAFVDIADTARATACHSACPADPAAEPQCGCGLCTGNRDVTWLLEHRWPYLFLTIVLLFFNIGVLLLLVLALLRQVRRKLRELIKDRSEQLSAKLPEWLTRYLFAWAWAEDAADDEEDALGAKIASLWKRRGRDGESRSGDDDDSDQPRRRRRARSEAEEWTDSDDDIGEMSQELVQAREQHQEHLREVEERHQKDMEKVRREAQAAGKFRKQLQEQAGEMARVFAMLHEQERTAAELSVRCSQMKVERDQERARARLAERARKDIAAGKKKRLARLHEEGLERARRIRMGMERGSVSGATQSDTESAKSDGSANSKDGFSFGSPMRARGVADPDLITASSPYGSPREGKAQPEPLEMPPGWAGSPPRQPRGSVRSNGDLVLTGGGGLGRTASWAAGVAGRKAIRERKQRVDELFRSLSEAARTPADANADPARGAVDGPIPRAFLKAVQHSLGEQRHGDWISDVRPETTAAEVAQVKEELMRTESIRAVAGALLDYGHMAEGADAPRVTCWGMWCLCDDIQLAMRHSAVAAALDATIAGFDGTGEQPRAWFFALGPRQFVEVIGRVAAAQYSQMNVAQAMALVITAMPHHCAAARRDAAGDAALLPYPQRYEVGVRLDLHRRRHEAIARAYEAVALAPHARGMPRTAPYFLALSGFKALAAEAGLAAPADTEEAVYERAVRNTVVMLPHQAVQALVLLARAQGPPWEPLSSTISRVDQVLRMHAHQGGTPLQEGGSGLGATNSSGLLLPSAPSAPDEMDAVLPMSPRTPDDIETIVAGDEDLDVDEGTHGS